MVAQTRTAKEDFVNLTLIRKGVYDAIDAFMAGNPGACTRVVAAGISDTVRELARLKGKAMVPDPTLRKWARKRAEQIANIAATPTAEVSHPPCHTRGRKTLHRTSLVAHHFAPHIGHRTPHRIYRCNEP